MIRGYFEDMSPGDRIETRARTITESDVVNFAGLSGDWHPLHTDAEYAKRGPFGERIAHGLLVISIATGLAPLDPDTVLAFYGVDRLRFVRPARLGVTVRVTSEVLKTEPRDIESGIIVSEVRVLDSADELLATGQFRMLVRRRPLTATIPDQEMRKVATARVEDQPCT